MSNFMISINTIFVKCCNMNSKSYVTIHTMFVGHLISCKYLYIYVITMQKAIFCKKILVYLFSPRDFYHVSSFFILFFQLYLVTV